MTSRRILRLSGPDTREFLQGLVTNDIRKLDQAPIYAAILTPQGKFITDFFLSAEGDSVLLDVAEADADALVQRLTMYKLRADVTIDATGLHLHRGLENAPDDAYSDPRDARMGWRAYRDTPQTDDTTDWDALRDVFRLGVPIGLTSLAEVALFAGTAVMMGWLGTIALAAHGVALTLAGATFMLHLGLSNAATIRAGNAMGRKDRAGLKRGAWAILFLSFVFCSNSACNPSG